MSRSANTDSALNSAPGSLGSEKTTVVLSTSGSGSATRLITRNRVMLSEKSWISDCRISRPNTCAARSEAMAPAPTRCFSFTSFALPAVS